MTKDSSRDVLADADLGDVAKAMTFCLACFVFFIWIWIANPDLGSRPSIGRHLWVAKPGAVLFGLFGLITVLRIVTAALHDGASVYVADGNLCVVTILGVRRFPLKDIRQVRVSREVVMLDMADGKTRGVSSYMTNRSVQGLARMVRQRAGLTDPTETSASVG